MVVTVERVVAEKCGCVFACVRPLELSGIVFLFRMGGLETDLLSLLGVMPGPEEDLERKLADLERAKKAELRKWVEQGQRDSSQLSRLEAQKEGIM